MAANDIQIAGDHYKKRKYQHWDWVCDIKLHYLLACASKYVCRWPDKNGKEDLRKAIHYLEKAIERKVPDPCPFTVGGPVNCVFLEQYPDAERDILRAILRGNYMSAIARIDLLLEGDGEPA